LDVVIGTLVHRQGAYVLDKFLANQQQVQLNYPSSEIVLATNESDFIEELDGLLGSQGLRGEVVLYETTKPQYARSRLWNICCGREAIREYVLSRTAARHLLFLDADMTFDPSVVTIMEREILNHDAVFSGYPLHRYGIGLAGCGCVMLTRSILEKLRFRCYEFKSGEIIFEDNLLEMDLFRSGGRIKKGFFLHITHYKNPTESKHIEPQKLGLWRKITNNNFIRYMLIRTSIAAHCNIPWHLKVLLSELTDSQSSVRSN
jgi:hypothetical protein